MCAGDTKRYKFQVYEMKFFSSGSGTSGCNKDKLVIRLQAYNFLNWSGFMPTCGGYCMSDGYAQAILRLIWAILSAQ